MQYKRIAVTGGFGFLGGHVIAELYSRNYRKVFPISRGCYDLTHEDDVGRFYKEINPDIVIHLAAACGGIEANRQSAGSFCYKNLVMGANLIELARIHKVKKLVLVGTVCSYPKFTEVPFKEEDIWNGYPEETNAPYGLAKKMHLVLSQAYRQQYNFNSIYLIPVNLYGPCDNFDLTISHVIPALIRKFIEARESGIDEVECWGDGSASREFLYVKDAARAIVLATEKYKESDPVNIGAGFEITIKDLVDKIAGLVGYKGGVRWNTDKPNGQPRRKLDTSKAKERFGFEASTEFDEGLRATINWYINRGQNENTGTAGRLALSN